MMTTNRKNTFVSRNTEVLVFDPVPDLIGCCNVSTSFTDYGARLHEIRERVKSTLRAIHKWDT